jgi:hypothetical protein
MAETAKAQSVTESDGQGNGSKVNQIREIHKSNEGFPAACLSAQYYDSFSFIEV